MSHAARHLSPFLKDRRGARRPGADRPHLPLSHAGPARSGDRRSASRFSRSAAITPPRSRCTRRCSATRSRICFWIALLVVEGAVSVNSQPPTPSRQLPAPKALGSHQLSESRSKLATRHARQPMVRAERFGGLRWKLGVDDEAAHRAAISYISCRDRSRARGGRL
jgi:hypothetical protein